MKNKQKRVALYASDLSPFTSGTSYANYKLYGIIKSAYELPKQIRLTTLHVADFYKKPVEEIDRIIFGKETDAA